MELEPIITQFFGDILRPIVTTAVEEAISKVTAPAPTDDFINVKEACKMLRCSETTFYSHVNNGLIKVEKSGRRNLVRKEKLLNDLATGKLRLRKDRNRK